MYAILRKAAALLSLVAAVAFAPSLAKAQCGNGPAGALLVTTPNGTFDDGSGFGTQYQNGQNCFWKITPSNNPAQIAILFNYFNTEQGFDSVYVYNDTTYAASALIGAFSGPATGSTLTSLSIPPVVATSGRALIRFKTDGSVTREGWELHYVDCVNPLTITPSGLTTFFGGSITLTAPAGLPNYTFNTGDTTQTITVTNSGRYTVYSLDTLTNCVSVGSINVQNTNTVCAGSSIQLNPTLPVATGTPLFATDSFTVSPSLAYDTILNGFDTTNCAPHTGRVLAFNGTGDRGVFTNDMTSSTTGASIQFDLYIGTTFSNLCEDADFGEDVIAEYSTNGGTTWSNIQTFTTNNTDPYNGVWGTFLGSIPVAANTPFRVRVHQPVNSGTGTDNWAIDNFGVYEVASNVTYTYAYSPSTGLSNPNISNPVATISANTQYVLTTTASNGMVYTDTLHLFAYAPTITVANNDTAICNGDSVRLTSSPADHYLWSTGDTTQSIFVHTTGIYTVTATINATSCVATSLPRAIQVNTPIAPIVTAMGATTFCNGGSVILMSNIGNDIHWNTGDTTASITVTTSGTYFATYIDPLAGCTAMSNSITVINATPSLLLTASNDTICGSTQITLKALTQQNLAEDFSGAVPNPAVFDSIVLGTVGAPCVPHTGNALLFNGNGLRGATTPAINTSNGATVAFDLFISTSFASGCEDADQGEEIFLQYSTNNGASWTDIHMFATTNTAPFNGVWGTYTTVLPVGAQSAATKLRIVQPLNSGQGLDNWNLDNFSLQSAGISSGLTYNFSGNGLPRRRFRYRQREHHPYGQRHIFCNRGEPCRRPQLLQHRLREHHRAFCRFGPYA